MPVSIYLGLWRRVTASCLTDIEENIVLSFCFPLLPEIIMLAISTNVLWNKSIIWALWGWDCSRQGEVTNSGPDSHLFLLEGWAVGVSLPSTLPGDCAHSQSSHLVAAAAPVRGMPYSFAYQWADSYLNTLEGSERNYTSFCLFCCHGHCDKTLIKGSLRGERVEWACRLQPIIQGSQGRNSSRDHRRLVRIGSLLGSGEAMLLKRFGDTCQAIALPTVGWILLRQAAIKGMPHRLAHRPIWWRRFQN